MVASAVKEEAEHSCALVISLKEDSERRRQRAITRQSQGSPQSPLDNAADGGILAPSSPRSTDMSVTNSSASSDISLSMFTHSPVLESATHEVPSPPPIGPLKELHARSSSLHNVGMLLFASPDHRFGLDNAMNEFGNLSPQAVFTPPRRGSLSDTGRKADEREPLDALAYLQSLTSTPCSSSSSGLSPPGVDTPSTPIRPTLPLSAGLDVHQSLTAASMNDETDSHHSRAPLRELHHHQYQQQYRQQLNPRGSLYTVTTVAPSVPAAEMAALHAIQQRTIAAKLTGSNTQQPSSNESDGEAAAINVKQPLHQQSRTSRSAVSKRKRTKKKSLSGKKSRSESNIDRRCAAKDSEKENKRPQQCEQCHRKQANTEYGTGRFCGPTCARTFSITKRSATLTPHAPHCCAFEGGSVGSTVHNGLPPVVGLCCVVMVKGIREGRRRQVPSRYLMTKQEKRRESRESRRAARVYYGRDSEWYTRRVLLVSPAVKHASRPKNKNLTLIYRLVTPLPPTSGCHSQHAYARSDQMSVNVTDTDIETNLAHCH